MVCLEDLLYIYLMCVLVCVKCHTRYVLLHITLLIACLCVLSVEEYYERVSAGTDCSLHRNISELSVILAPDPTPSRPIEMCEECVSRKERENQLYLWDSNPPPLANRARALPLCYGRATDGRPRKCALIQRERVLSTPKRARS